MARLESWLEAARMDGFGAGRTDGCDEDAAQCVYRGVPLTLACRELEEMLELDTGREDRGLKLTG
jgi:hypothetical protein